MFDAPSAHPVRRRAVLVLGALAAVLASLSIHVVMLQNLHVPYPSHLSGQWLVRLPDRILRVAGVIALYRLLPERLRADGLRSFACLWLLLLLVNEDLVRGPLMNVINLSGRTPYPFLDAVPSYLTAGLAALGVVLGRRLLGTLAGCAGVAVVVGVVVYFGWAQLAAHLWAPVRDWTGAHEGRTLYQPPYDWHIELPAYITFLEPVVGGFLVAALARPRLPAPPLQAWAGLALLLFALRGQFFSCFTYIPVSKTDPVTAMLSVGQFSLESLALAVIVAGAWLLAERSGRASAG